MRRRRTPKGESSESIIRGALRPLHPRAQPFILCLNIRPPHCARVVKLHYSFFIIHFPARHGKIKKSAGAEGFNFAPAFAAACPAPFPKKTEHKKCASKRNAHLSVFQAEYEPVARMRIKRSRCRTKQESHSLSSLPPRAERREKKHGKPE